MKLEGLIIGFTKASSFTLGGVWVKSFTLFYCRNYCNIIS